MRDRVLQRMVLTACLMACVGTAAHAQTLLVVNQGSSTVSFFDPQSNRLLATLDENTPAVHGHEIAVAPDGRTAFLPIYGSSGVGKPGIDGHEILVLDLPSRKIVGHIDLGHPARPHLPVFNPATGMLYVTTELDRAITIIDPHTRKVIGKIPTGQEQSHMVVLTSDGKRGYTANVGPGSVSVLDTAARKTLAIIPVSGKIQRISISRDNKLVFTSDQIAPRLAVIDTATNKIKQWIDLPGFGYGAVPSMDGRWLLLAIPTKNEVAVIDLKKMQVAHRISVPTSPQEIMLSPDGKIAYVTCNVGGKVAAINVAQLKVDAVMDAGKMPDGLAWVK